MADEARLPDAQRSRALLIGVGEFTDDHFPGLPSVRRNLTGLGEVLTSPWGAGLPDNHCRRLDDPTDMRMVGGHLMQFAAQAQDLLLVYYAGHGLIDAQGELYLALSTTSEDLVSWTAVPFSLLRQVIADSAADNRVLILDCCFSGRAIEAMADPASVVAGQIAISGTYTLTATSANTLARAPRGAQHTTFTGALLNLLHDGIPDGPELLTLNVIYQQLLQNLTAKGAPQPKQWGTNTVNLLALARNRATNGDLVSEPEHVNLDGAARRLGLRLRQLRSILRTRGDFPEPAGTDGAEPYWHEDAVLRWAAASGPELAARVPLPFWPDAIAPADYLGTETHEKFVIQRWQTQSGPIAVVWSLPGGFGPIDLMTIAPRIKATSTAVAEMRGDFGIDGPGVTAINTASPDDGYIVPWHDMARVLGRPVPYWPFPLRIAELICAWKPGAEPVTAPARPDLDTSVLLRLAAVFDPEHPTHRTLLNLARVAQARNTASALRDLDLLRQKISRGPHPEATTAIAAVPMPVPTADRNDLDPMVRRAGWLEVLGRSDTLSMQCVREAHAWDHG
ncbi:MAG TPA: caspase family protein, partial [Pseudonocardiaceae bacterium]|nr:caspase family protein [Pseudonocardiaceae bacterium]